jgi:hypothetical protein
MKYNREKDAYTAIQITVGALGASLLIIGVYIATGVVKLANLIM